MNLAEAMPQYQARINAVLNNYLSPEHHFPTKLHAAMRYAVLGGGKRIRALCVYFTGEALGAEASLLDDAAAAVELVHAYSLIHDDLPAMDDDDLRHGKPSCHKAFGEANAILAGDALQSLAFQILAASPFYQTQRLRMVAVLAQAIGSSGMAGGQVADLAAEGHAVDITHLEQIYRLKTGALITASIVCGAIAANGDQTVLHNLQNFGEKIGLAFQIHDDVIDIESSTATLGKTQGADIARQKSTFPALLGLAEAKQKVAENYQQGMQILSQLNGDFTSLKALAEFIINRRF